MKTVETTSVPDQVFSVHGVAAFPSLQHSMQTQIFYQIKSFLPDINNVNTEQPEYFRLLADVGQGKP